MSPAGVTYRSSDGSISESILFSNSRIGFFWDLRLQQTTRLQWPECDPVWASCSRCESLTHTVSVIVSHTYNLTDLKLQKSE